MNLYLKATTLIKDLFIDFIEVKLISGETVSLQWDESYIDRNDNGFSAEYRRLYFNENKVDTMDALNSMQVVGVQIYSDTEKKPYLSIDELVFEDSDLKTLTFESVYNNQDTECNWRKP